MPDIQLRRETRVRLPAFRPAIDLIGRARRRVEAMAAKPIYATMATALLFFAGVFGSLYSPEIRSAFPFGLGLGPIHWPAVIFWVCGLIGVMMIRTNLDAADRERARAEGQLIDQTKKLEELIRTLPPVDFLQHFKAFYDLAYEAFSQGQTNQSGSDEAKDANSTVQFLLFCLLALIQKFEAKGLDLVYSGNVMLYMPVESMPDRTKAEVRARLRFIEPETDLSALEGILDLETDLSTSTRNDGEGPDESLASMAFPVPRIKQHERSHLWRVLPGAPLAFVTGEVFGYTDTAQLIEWCRTEGDFAPSISDQIVEYFRHGAGRNIKSFVSFPLISPIEKRAIGVINVHCDHTGMLEEKEQSKHLWLLLAPFISLLAEAIVSPSAMTDVDSSPSSVDLQEPGSL